jgi:hypothetical protein
MYAQIIDGVVVKTQGQLPKSTERVSNFYLLPEEEHRQHGWYKIVEDLRSCPEYHTQSEEIVFEGGEVVQKKTFTPIPLADVKAQRLAQIKSEATSVLLSEIPIHQQVNAALGIYDAQEVTRVKSRIVEVKAAVDAAEDALIAAKTFIAVKAVVSPTFSVATAAGFE